MYSPQLNQAIGLERQADMRRVAERDRIAALASASHDPVVRFARMREVFRAFGARAVLPKHRPARGVA